MQIHELRSRLLKEVSKRVIEWQEVFELYVEEVCGSGLVRELYLIGSRARGEHSSSSDFDLLAVVSREEDPLEVAERLRSLRKKSFPLDLLILSEDDLEDPIYSEMLKDKRRLC
ncbi:MAG: nucleotidyltransferase domain-containing protein [Candidatus Korarchaeum sp.]|nr:nucleotidyltransferase domain-containing protein [Candidatus Korarchaeum sp.]MDW8036038.1 nucleotidyltransferase domain-containing protein [Candidatus Korarchaeum sp.]